MEARKRPISQEQSECVALAVSGHSLIITGQCGTGKTFTMRTIIRSLRQMGLRLAVTASTGMAALNYEDGTTLHHWAELGDCRYSKEGILERLLNDDGYVTCKRGILSTDVLVIDEIGMVSAEVYETLEYICRMVKGKPNVFGGMQIVASGDFKQLPPVPNLMHNDPGKYCLTSPVFDQTFAHRVHLNQVQRQHEIPLIKAVEELCDGTPSLETDNLMASLDRPIDGEPTLLFGTNFDSDFVNQDKLDGMTGTQFTYRSTDTGDKNYLRKIAAPKVIALKEGAPVILIRNISKNLCNGMKGTIHSLKEGHEPVVNFNQKLFPINMIKKCVFEVYDASSSSIKATRVQYPLKLAFALTVHRAQGQTLECLEVDCATFFAAGQLGVAIGRAVATSKLRVVNYNKNASRLRHTTPVYNYYRHIYNKNELLDFSCCKHSVVSVDIGKETAARNFSIDSETDGDTSINTANNEMVQIGSESEVQTTESETSEIVHSEHGQAVDIEEFCRIHSMRIAEMDKSRFVAFIQKNIAAILPTTGRPKEAWATSYKMMHQFFLSDEYTKEMKLLFQVQELQTSQNAWATKLVFYIHKHMIHATASDIIKRQHNSVESTTTNNNVSDAGMAKIRYVAGACLAKITGRLRTAASSNMTSLAHKYMRTLAYKKQALLSTLRETEAVVVTETNMPETLTEIAEKQGPTRGLYCMGDDVFAFFVKLHDVILNLLSTSRFDLHGSDIYLKCIDYLINSTSLTTAWGELFPASNTSIEEVGVTTEGLLHDLYTAVAEHYLRIAFVDALHTLKEAIPRKKKMALRAKIEGSTSGKKKKNAKKIVAITPSNTCPSCSRVCIEEPQREEDHSICCDSCNRWFHQHCQGVKKASTLKVWKCSICKRSKKKKTASEV